MAHVVAVDHWRASSLPHVVALVCPSVCMSVCLSVVCLSLYLPVYLFILSLPHSFISISSPSSPGFIRVSGGSKSSPGLLDCVKNELEGVDGCSIRQLCLRASAGNYIIPSFLNSLTIFVSASLAQLVNLLNFSARRVLTTYGSSSNFCGSCSVVY